MHRVVGSNLYVMNKIESETHLSQQCINKLIQLLNQHLIEVAPSIVNEFAQQQNMAY